MKITSLQIRNLVKFCILYTLVFLLPLIGNAYVPQGSPFNATDLLCQCLFIGLCYAASRTVYIHVFINCAANSAFQRLHDKKLLSPYNITVLSTRQVTRIKKFTTQWPWHSTNFCSKNQHLNLHLILPRNGRRPVSSDVYEWQPLQTSLNK